MRRKGAGEGAERFGIRGKGRRRAEGGGGCPLGWIGWRRKEEQCKEEEEAKEKGKRTFCTNVHKKESRNKPNNLAPHSLLHRPSCPLALFLQLNLLPPDLPADPPPHHCTNTHLQHVRRRHDVVVRVPPLPLGNQPRRHNGRDRRSQAIRPVQDPQQLVAVLQSPQPGVPGPFRDAVAQPADDETDDDGGPGEVQREQEVGDDAAERREEGGAALAEVRVDGLREEGGKGVASKGGEEEEGYYGIGNVVVDFELLGREAAGQFTGEEVWWVSTKGVVAACMGRRLEGHTVGSRACFILAWASGEQEALKEIRACPRLPKAADMVR